MLTPDDAQRLHMELDALRGAARALVRRVEEIQQSLEPSLPEEVPMPPYEKICVWHKTPRTR